MSPTPYAWVLLGSTFVLSALWAAVLLVLVRLREADGASGRPAHRGHMGVELAWAVIPALLVLAVVVPALQSGSLPVDGPAARSPRVAAATPVVPAD